MLKNINYLFLFILSGFLISCEKNEEVAPYKQEFIEDQSYGSHTRNSMDVAIPKERNHDRPVLLFLHGGAWLTGDKAMFSDVIKDFSAQGYLAASMNYRYSNLNSGTHHPAQMEDIQKAIGYLLDEPGKWDLSPQDLILLGHSAGGHLSLLYGYGYDNQDHVKGICSIAGPVNLIDSLFLQIPNVQFGIYNYLGDQLEDDTTLWKSASPYFVVEEDDPPTMLIHGKKDGLVPYQQVEGLKKRLDSLQVPSNFILYEDEGHDIPNGTHAEETYEAIEEWLLTID